MSGDVQPRKRKDKKKKKDDGDPIPEKLHVPIFTNNTITEDVNIHVHKDEGTGGGICAKFVFFILFSALAVLIGLIITEHKGLTDIDTVDPNSKFAQIFEGWVDTNSDTHDDHEIEDGSLEDDDHEEHDHEEDDHYQEEDDHDQEEDDLEEDDQEEDDQIDAQDEDDHEDNLSEEVDENVQYSEEDDDDDEDEELDDNEENEQEEDEDEDGIDDANDYDDEDNPYTNKNVAASEEENPEEQDEDDDKEDDEQDEETDKYEDEQQLDQEDHNDDEDEEENDKDDEEDDIDQNQEDDKDEDDKDEDDIMESKEKRYISKEKLDDQDGEGDNDDANKDDEDANDDVEDNNQKSAEKDDKPEEGVEDDQKLNKEEEDDIKEKNAEKPEAEAEEEFKDGVLENSNKGKIADKSEPDSDDDNDYTNITNEDEYKIKQQIDEAQNSIKKNTTYAIALFDKLLQKFPSSPRSLYGKALALDHLAEIKRSNEILQKALQLYERVLKTEKVPVALFHLAVNRCINRWRFLGQYKKAILIHELVIDQFPDSPKHLNSLAVTYLIINRIEDARTIFKQVLMKWPEDGVALVHYGFILKTADNELEKAVRYLQKGLHTKDEGVLDGRFYFHLGDALVRLGRSDEALKIYEEGTKNKLFLSKYQRSLYNVPRLSAKSWWSPKDLPFSNSLKLLTESWTKIKDEGLAVLNEKGYFQDESENLKDTGEWKQLELYSRGQKNVKNCKKCPFTCSIIDQISAAKTCRRGQTKFSVMHPGTHVWPHCGPTNCRLRVHLGLKVPPKTFIRVAEETRSWKEGDLLIFDDSLEHEVWHNGTEFRLILIVDVWHPELTPTERNSLSPI